VIHLAERPSSRWMPDRLFIRFLSAWFFGLVVKLGKHSTQHRKLSSLGEKKLTTYHYYGKYYEYYLGIIF